MICVPIRWYRGKKGQDKKDKTNTNVSVYTVRKAKKVSRYNVGPRNATKQRAHGADDILAEKESDKSFTILRVDTVSHREGSINYRITLKLLAGRMHTVSAKSRLRKDLAKLPQFSRADGISTPKRWGRERTLDPEILAKR